MQITVNLHPQATAVALAAHFSVPYVAWGLKDQKTGAVNKLTNQKNQELKALDEDFRKVLEDDK